MRTSQPSVMLQNHRADWCLLALLLLTGLAPAEEALKVEWELRYDEGRASLHELQATDDGGLVAIGAEGDVQTDILVMRFDSTGKRLWRFVHGEEASEAMHSGIQTADLGFLLGGARSIRQQDGEHFVAYALKLDSMGRLLWSRILEGSGVHTLLALCQAEDGGAIAVGWGTTTGSSKAHLSMIKISDDGEIRWQKFHPPSEDYATGAAVQPVRAGGYIVAGNASVRSESDFYLLRTDLEGSKRWDLTAGGPRHQNCQAVLEMADGSFIAVGTSYQHDFGNIDFVYAIRVSENGQLVWERVFSLSGSSSGMGLAPARDGGVIVSGSTEQVLGSFTDAFLLKLSLEGTKQWEQRLESPEGDGLRGGAVRRTRDGGLILGGSWNPVSPKIYLAKFAPETPVPLFHRGDTNGDNRIDVSDGLCLLRDLFEGTSVLTCLEAADADNNGKVDCSDAISILEYLFRGSVAPADPGPPPLACGADTDDPGTEKNLGCAQYIPCAG